MSRGGDTARRAAAPTRQILGAGAEELRSLMSRSRDVVLLAALIGAATGLGVAGLDYLVVDVLLNRVREAPVGVLVLAPGVGLCLTALVLRRLGGLGSPATADEYVKALPQPGVPFDPRPVPARLFGAVATLGLGGSAGLEGPAIYLGSAIGAVSFDRLRRVLRGVDRRAALVAGAAAGVAAIFKAPATGAVFALEVPFQDDLARRSLLPALVGAATGYSAFVAVHGTEVLLPVVGSPSVALVDLGVAAGIGLTCGVGARVFAAVMGLAKRLSVGVPLVPRLAVASVVLGGLAFASTVWFDDRPLSMGPGYESVRFALDPSRGLWVIALLATVRVIATATTVGGGGVAGMFVPLVVQGALTGRLLAGMFHANNQSLYVLVGVAAFLGAGYRVPLAAVMFVAEATGRPGFVVPGLVAATVATLVMADKSVSAYQRRRRDGHLEERAALAVTEVLAVDPAVSRAGDSAATFFAEHVALARRRAVPLVDADGRYEGLVLLDDVLAVDPGDWPEVPLGDLARTDVPTVGPGATLGDALRVMVDAEIDHVPVVDDAGGLRGMVTADSIVDRSRLLDRLDQIDPA